MKAFENELKTYCQLHWWNYGTKTLSFKGELCELLKSQNITFSIRKTENEGIYSYVFKSAYNITFKIKGNKYDFAHYAKQAMQMELVRMGDKSTLYIAGTWRPTVTVNH